MIFNNETVEKLAALIASDAAEVIRARLERFENDEYLPALDTAVREDIIGNTSAFISDDHSDTLCIDLHPIESGEDWSVLIKLDDVIDKEIVDAEELGDTTTLERVAGQLEALAKRVREEIAKQGG